MEAEMNLKFWKLVTTAESKLERNLLRTYTAQKEKLSESRALTFI